MSFEKRMEDTFTAALQLPFNQRSKYVLMSDCHRGTGTANDNFLKNEVLYLAALKHYYAENFTYLELGDGDELWENRSMRKIKEVHLQSFSLLADFYEKKRAYFLYGNHDMVKKSFRFSKKHMKTGYCSRFLTEKALFPDVVFYPGIILKDAPGKCDIYLTHGHQADPLNSTFWRISRFLVRYLWRNLERLGIPDPTSAAKNNTRKKKSEEILAKWAEDQGVLLITGHTHHPMAGEAGSHYLNTGSCVSPAGITAIEIGDRTLTLVKWSLSVRDDETLYVSREVLGEPLALEGGKKELQKEINYTKIMEKKL